MPAPILCKMCGKEMEEIGKSGTTMVFEPFDEKVYTPVIIYQCPEDKTIAVN